MNQIPLRWVKNDVQGAEFAFGGGRHTPPLTYQGAPVLADFELSYEALAPFVSEVLDQAATLEAKGHTVEAVEIKAGVVTVR